MDSQLYFNGDIITMEEPLYTEAVFCENGVIQKTGPLSEVIKFINKETKQIDLKGKTCMPSFIDSHSHITAFASTLGMVSLKECKSFSDIINTLKYKKGQYKKGQWVIGFGYDNNILKEKKHPDCILLDEVSKENPVIISHVSGHMGVVNTAALQLAEITKYTPDPKGGRIGRYENGKTPNGYLEENAFLNFSKNIPSPSIEEKLLGLEQAQNVYFSYGITTAQEGMAKTEDILLLKEWAKQKKLLLDVIAYVDLKNCPNAIEQNKEYETYQNHFRIGGYKIFLDGSPQGKTAWLSAPYENSENGYCGYGVYENDTVRGFFEKAMIENRQILVHSNGDAACEQMIDCLKKAQMNTKKDTAKIRPVMIHAQTVKIEQLPKMKTLNIIPSYFVAHTYYWGDVHINNLGKRAKSISPVASTAAQNMIFTLHQDTPVIYPNMIETIWCAVNRKTKQGKLLGQKEQASVLDALKAVTIYGAYQYFEENKKGSIKEGKQADFVILDKNPLKIEKEKINEIKVIETIKNGKSVYIHEF